VSAITTHVLDTSRGKPAKGVAVTLAVETAGGWQQIGQGVTDDDGRARELLPDGYQLAAGVYRLVFETAPYFASLQTESFYRDIVIVFAVVDPTQNYHVPLLLNPFGYSTYRGS
jgi:5-hydroxyisourate hydrolase